MFRYKEFDCIPTALQLAVLIRTAFIVGMGYGVARAGEKGWLQGTSRQAVGGGPPCFG